MIKSKVASLPRERRPTFYFQQYAKRFSPVFLTTEVDFSNAARARDEYRRIWSRRLSHITIIIHQASRVIAGREEVKLSVKNGLFPKMIQHGVVTAKFTVSKTVNGRGVVVPGLIAASNERSIEDIQDSVDYYRDTPDEQMAETKGLSILRNLPPLLGRVLFNTMMSNLRVRERVQGTFSVTSLGHKSVQYFMPQITSTVCFGVGAVEPKLRLIKGELVERPVLHLTLAFDHNAIDGAIAAEVLSEVKSGIETFELQDGV
jgi:pyruvate/2-oxoglutarate dehydrogenase complex dihydrolipoamide acyltransferase (E2) component